MREASALSLHIQYSVHIFLNVCRPAGSRPTFWGIYPGFPLRLRSCGFAVKFGNMSVLQILLLTPYVYQI